jgi:invasion protein IalB
MDAPLPKGLAAALCLAAAALSAPAAGAQDFKLINVFGDWSAFSGRETGKTVCYMGSVPRKKSGKYKARGKTLIVIIHRPAEKALNVVNIQAGYTYKPGSEVQFTIDGATFTLFTDGGYAWAKDAEADRALTLAMRVGSRLVVRGTSAGGTATTDTYSLKGFTAAHKAIGKACGVK